VHGSGLHTPAAHADGQLRRAAYSTHPLIKLPVSRGKVIKRPVLPASRGRGPTVGQLCCMAYEGGRHSSMATWVAHAPPTCYAEVSRSASHAAALGRPRHPPLLVQCVEGVGVRVVAGGAGCARSRGARAIRVLAVAHIAVAHCIAGADALWPDAWWVVRGGGQRLHGLVKARTGRVLGRPERRQHRRALTGARRAAGRLTNGPESILARYHAPGGRLSPGEARAKR
jgi:hypothetical protein